MRTGTFFFQGASLLSPEAGLADDGPANWELSPEYKELFPSSDVFSVPETGGGNIFCVSVPSGAALPPGWQSIPVRRVLANSSEQIRRILRALHIAQWRPESRFCGSCGNKNDDAGNCDTGEIARLCPVCGRIEFPRITPAVIVIITNDEGKILLARNKKFTPGLYSLIAGYAEAGENLEAAVARETLEEVNIKLDEIRYITSQPWPFPNSLMAGFSARYAGGELKPDGIEIEEAGWFSPDSLPQLPGEGSLSRKLIDWWLDK